MADGFPLNSICAYAGSADALHDEYLAGARAMGAALARRGIQLVYGAGKTGLMGAVADGALEAGGRVLGVITNLLNTPELVHAGLTELRAVETMHERKMAMFSAADGFIALPGGYGTFDELFETLTWAQIGLHSKPVGLLNLRGYYDPLLALVAHARDEGFIYPEHTGLLVAASEPDALLEQMAAYRPPAGLERWVNR